MPVFFDNFYMDLYSYSYQYKCLFFYNFYADLYYYSYINMHACLHFFNFYGDLYFYSYIYMHTYFLIISMGIYISTRISHAYRFYKLYVGPIFLLTYYLLFHNLKYFLSQHLAYAFKSNYEYHSQF
jgi:hypothetical protein